jgi:hypothetical protein
LNYLSMKYQEFFGRPQKSNTRNISSNENQVSEPSQNIVVLNSVDEVRLMDQFQFCLLLFTSSFITQVQCVAKGKRKAESWEPPKETSKNGETSVTQKRPRQEALEVNLCIKKIFIEISEYS